MPQYRKLHTKTVESLDINDMPDDFTRLFWVLLPLALCREGRGIDSAAWLRSRVFPLRLDVTCDMVSDAMDWYAQRGMIKRYEVDGRHYFYVPTFHKYQGSTTKEADSIYPAPVQELVQTSSRPTPEQVESRSTTDSVCSIQYADADESPTPPTDGRHPAFAVYEQLSGCLITAKIQMDDITEHVPRDESAIQRWGEVVRAWIAVGWKPRNVTGMLDYFRRGDIPGERYAGQPRAPPEQAPVVIPRALLDTIPGVD
jgi:hypothetical protein